MSSELGAIQSPSGVNKTSLITKFVLEYQDTHPNHSLINIDLWTALDLKSCLNRLGKAIAKYLNSEKTDTSYFYQDITEHFAFTDFIYRSGEVSYECIGDITIHIDELGMMLKSLNNWLVCKEKTLTIHIDEFFVFGKVDTTYNSEVAILNVLETSNQINFIFTGSDKKLMNRAMDGTGRAMYGKCLHLAIKMDSRKYYKDWINKKAKERWGQNLSERVVNLLLDLTDCHAFYTGSLMETLIAMDTTPTEINVAISWDLLIDERKSSIKTSFSNLNTNEKRAVVALATSDVPVSKVQSDAFARRAGIKVGSIGQTIRDLQDKDVIELVGKRWQLADPGLYHLIHRDCR